MNVVLEDGLQHWTASSLQQAVEDAQTWLQGSATRVLASVLDNSAAFVALDEALLASGRVHVPLPPFFTAAQMQHALVATGTDTLVTEAAWAKGWPGLTWQAINLAGRELVATRLPSAPHALPPGTAKITFTSGTTGTPKGVCLSRAAMASVAQGLVTALSPLGIERHLNALPFSVLLENIAGLMAPRQQGTTLVTLGMQALGLQGSSQFDAPTFHRTVSESQANSLILLPQMLRAWCGYLQHTGQRAPGALRFVAVGGAAVGPALLHAAHSLGIPAYEGYGLSEGASVQTLNLPGASKPGSVGRPLGHAQLRCAADGEIEVSGSLFTGYLGDPTPSPAWWPTGDLGSIDTDGFVYIQGRKKNVLITSFGRNVSPEWVETSLCSQPGILQAVVFGDGEPSLSAVLWPMGADLSDAALQAAVDRSNALLPDYARVSRWTRARAAFHISTGLATANGRPQRTAIWAQHADLLSTLAATKNPATTP
ncbi:AMP-binding protein [Rhodoferax sp. 4810]|nr:AMP-binding protein [Rhodoferax jenense]